MSNIVQYLLSGPAEILGNSISSRRKCLSFAVARLFASAFITAASLLFVVQNESKTQNNVSAENSDAFLKLGDVATSGFAGVKLQTEGLKPGVDPQTKTVIDPEGVTLRIYDGGFVVGPYSGQKLELPLRKDFKAKEIGHVFSLAFDNLPADDRGTPGLYVAATSAFGLHVVGPDRDGDGLLGDDRWSVH